MTKSRIRSDFDKAFFRRYYENPNTAVTDQEEIDRLAKFVVSYLDYLRVPVHTVLDVGCGVGMWRQALDNHGRTIDYTGIDVAEYVCEKYGWTRASIASFQSDRKYDLIVCQDVLHYLSDDDVRDGVANMAKMCRGALYLDVMTKEDSDADVYDPDRTDSRMRVRSAAWYRRLVNRHFFGCGGGMFIPKNSQAIVLELERS
jgi:2-polyprenyl-3-methyl-5-hydroxy-6-metoxy-1,4-benzoquinol methylase